ncbi:MAG: hypothetical protein ACI9C1_003143 [Candidatus Aldehydirespiratoraceae bacterium]|jgi:hypothetical protein
MKTPAPAPADSFGAAEKFRAFGAGRQGCTFRGVDRMTREFRLVLASHFQERSDAHERVGRGNNFLCGL